MKDKKALQPFNDKNRLFHNSEKAFFFLRHNNDIDHITPVLYKWLSTENIPTDVIITTQRSLLDDYRIEFLKKYKNVRIFHINDLFKKHNLEYIFNTFYFRYATQLDEVFKKYPFIRNIVNKIIRNIANTLFKGVDKAIVVFDWTYTHFAQETIDSAKKRKFITISLPHGGWPYFNFMNSNNELNYNCLNHLKYLNMFDYVVVPYTLCNKRYEKRVEKDKIKILGITRYSDEWIDINSKLIPFFNVKESDGKLKIIIFLRNQGYPIFWDEIIRTIKLILQFPNVYIIVKHHPRNTIAKELTKKLIKSYPEIKRDIDINLKFIYDDVNSASLLEWADLVIDLGTSISFEAIKQRKPVLMLEYANANYSLVSYYIKSAELKSRDDLYDILQRFIQNKNYKVYSKKERTKFIKEIIDVPDKYVLERYSKFLKMCFNKSINKK